MARLFLLSSMLVAVLGCSGTSDELDVARVAPSTSMPGTEPTPADAGATSDSAGPDAAPIEPPPQDSGAPKPKDAFDGAPAFATKTGPSTRQGGHSFAANTPKTNPAGKACLNCHGGGGAPVFSAAGTVYDGAKPAAGAEVRVVGADGVSASAYTDADGNFFFRASAQPLAFPALVGARDAVGTRLMSTTAPKGNCNECHSTAGGAGHIVVTP